MSLIDFIISTIDFLEMFTIHVNLLLENALENI